MKTAIVFFMSLLMISMAAGQLQIGTMPSNAEEISETFATNESAKIVGAMILGSVPDVIDLNDKANVTFGTSVYTDKGFQQALVSNDHELWIVPDDEFTNSTDVQMVVYNSTEGYAAFEVVGGFVRETTEFTILSTDGDAPLQCSSGNAGPWYNAIVKADNNWEARQL